MRRDGLRWTLEPEDWTAAADHLEHGKPIDPDVAEGVAGFLRHQAANGLVAHSEPNPEDD